MSYALAVVGAQYGSEGKGAVVSKLADEFDVHVRVGGPNAGHTIYYKDEPYVMQVLPCGWTNPKAELVLGRGMLLDIDRLLEEIYMLGLVAPWVKDRISIDPLIGVIDKRHYEAEGGVHGELHQRIGSTGKGVGAARLARVSREPKEFTLLKDHPRAEELQHMFRPDTPRFLRDKMRAGSPILLEGTQGSGLSLIHGPWPYVTSADTNAAQMAADAGIAPHRVHTLLVARTMPIRVAGNSGPLENETSWEAISARLGQETCERTTVTKKIRRIGAWDQELFEKAVTLNEPIATALTFTDYIVDPAEREAIEKDIKTHCPLLMVGNGGKPENIELMDCIHELVEDRK